MELRITSKRLSWSDSLRELVAYRDLLWILSYREISIRYKQTVIGILWVVLQPLIMTVLMTVIFGLFAKIKSGGIPYALFSFSGMTIMGFFTNAITRAGLSVVADERLITKVYFPRATIPLASILSSGLDFLVSLVLLLLIAAWYGFFPGIYFLAVVPASLITVLVSSGLGTAFAGLTVRYRDFRYVVPFFMQLAFYASPIIYPISYIPKKYLYLYYLNPMAGATELFRYGITGAISVDLGGVAISALVAFLCFLAGGIIFRQVEQSFADVI